jgi:multicomponent Na+:H+ antiporter subunit D
MWLPAFALLAGGLAWGLIPGLADGALRAATHFVEPGVYAATVLHGAKPPAAAAASLSPSTASYVYGVGAVVGALVVAAAGVARLRVVDATRPLFARLRALHSGHVGDYVAWLTAGVAVIGTAFAVTFR